MKITVSGGQFLADGFAVRGSFEMQEGERRILSYLSSRGCGCATIRATRGRLLIEDGAIGVIRLPMGAELYPLAAEVGSIAERFSSGGREILVRCRSGEPSEIVIAGDAVMCHETILPIRFPTMKLLTGQRAPILDVRAECDVGEYVALFSLGYDTTALLLEDCGEVRCEGNEVTVSRKLADRRGRHVVTRYLWRGDRFERSREITCSYAHTFIREEMGRLLLEAVLAEDDDSLLELLSEEIRDAEGIRSYFEGVLSLCPIPLSESPTAVTALKREGKETVAVTYDFEFDEKGLIRNVRCAEDENA